jgi:hypothetical protein
VSRRLASVGLALDPAGTLAAMEYPIENALFQWEEGYRRLEEVRDDPRAYRRAARAVDAIRDELRRRIGPTFRAGQLAGLYAEGTDWASEIVQHEDAPVDPAALADAAFWLYLRGASDFAGGRQVVLD